MPSSIAVNILSIDFLTVFKSFSKASSAVGFSISALKLSTTVLAILSITFGVKTYSTVAPKTTLSILNY